MDGFKSVLTAVRAATAVPSSPAAQNLTVGFVQKTIEEEVSLMEFQTALVSGRRDVRAARRRVSCVARCHTVVVDTCK